MADENDSLAFLSALADMAARLAEHRIVVHAVTYQAQGFGGWELEVGRRRVRILVSFGGKDRHLKVSTAELAVGSTARPWQLVEDHDFRSRRPDLPQLFSTVYAAITAHAGV